MGGKGRRRREKNYKAAHGGGQTGLPPPPDRSSLDALPAKLRKIMSFAESRKAAISGAQKNKGENSRVTEPRLDSEDKVGSKITGIRKDKKGGISMAKHPDVDDEAVQSHVNEKKKKKRKRKQVNDLRFEASGDLGVTGSKRKERKKQRLEERKKKRKKVREEENVGFQAQDEVKFGEVVEAPPKLVAVPKVFKTTQDASQERLRIRAVEAYRKRKGWTSRPGVRLPATAILSELS